MPGVIFLRGICLCKIVLWVQRSKPGRLLALPPGTVLARAVVKLYFLISTAEAIAVGYSLGSR